MNVKQLISVNDALLELFEAQKKDIYYIEASVKSLNFNDPMYVYKISYPYDSGNAICKYKYAGTLDQVYDTEQSYHYFTKQSKRGYVKVLTKQDANDIIRGWYTNRLNHEKSENPR